MGLFPAKPAFGLTSQEPTASLRSEWAGRAPPHIIIVLMVLTG
jgi:hypothetical protein